tara:strand:+ start:13 stop:540 length:528 start_codon:yes stop_codon:yes gene_type:complete
MGKDKASLNLNGKMLIEIVVENLRNAGILDIVVSVRNQQQSEWIEHIFDNRIQTLVDGVKVKGIWDVVKFALPNDGVLQIVPVDSPWFDAKSIEVITQKFNHNRSKIGVVPWSKNGPEPLLMQVDSSKLRKKMFNSNPIPLREFVNTDSFVKLEEALLKNENALRNLNYPSDFNI